MLIEQTMVLSYLSCKFIVGNVQVCLVIPAKAGIQYRKDFSHEEIFCLHYGESKKWNSLYMSSLRRQGLVLRMT
jgi:hypothetical protein